MWQSRWGLSGLGESVDWCLKSFYLYCKGLDNCYIIMWTVLSVIHLSWSMPSVSTFVFGSWYGQNIIIPVMCDGVSKWSEN